MQATNPNCFSSALHMKSITKIIFTNFAILTIGVIFIEVIFGNWISYYKNISLEKDPATRLTDRYYETVFNICPDPFLHHTYCPEISHKRQMQPADGGETIVNFINKSSIRVAGSDDMESMTNVASYDVINIGDSFLQADEIPYEYTLSRFLEAATGKKILQVGMGSWAPINFYVWLKNNQLPRGVEVNMFVMTNDVLPNYRLSNLNYYGLGNINESGELLFEDFSFIWRIFGESDFPGKLKHALTMNSAIYRLLLRIKTKLKEKKPKQNVPSPHVFSGTLTEPIKDCERMSAYNKITVDARDYVRLAFKINCWDEELLENVSSATTDLRKSIQEVSKVEGKVRILVVPAAWAFEDEGVVGKMNNRYKMAANAAITSEPLVNFITMKLADLPVEVISLEKVIKEFKQQKKQKFYFPSDGHWNKNAHQTLGIWMAENFYK
jgi:hypothetical protein